jgi:hypothetical protein
LWVTVAVLLLAHWVLGCPARTRTPPAYEEPDLRRRIIGTLGGHAAEQLVWTNATSTTRNLDTTPVDP